MRRNRAVTFLTLGVLALAGCSGVERSRFAERVWPDPPLTPRIKFVGLIRTAADVSGRSGSLRRALLGGETHDLLSQPMGVAASRDGRRLYVTDYAEHALVIFDLAGRRLTRVSNGNRDLASPLGVAVDAADNVYVVDSGTRSVVVFDARGQYLRTISHPLIERPTGIAIDAERRRLYLADSSRLNSDHHRIHVFDLDGHYTRSLGRRGREHGEFFFATYLAVDARGYLYVADTLNARIQVFEPDGRFVSAFGRPGDTPGTFDKPKGVALDGFGNVYVVDSSWSNVQIFDRHGDVLMVFGGRGHTDGLLFNPTGIAIDRENRIYVADAFNGRISIYQLVNTGAEGSVVTMPPAQR